MNPEAGVLATIDALERDTVDEIVDWQMTSSPAARVEGKGFHFPRTRSLDLPFCVRTLTCHAAALVREGGLTREEAYRDMGLDDLAIIQVESHRLETRREIGRYVLRTNDVPLNFIKPRLFIRNAEQNLQNYISCDVITIDLSISQLDHGRTGVKLRWTGGAYGWIVDNLFGWNPQAMHFASVEITDNLEAFVGFSEGQIVAEIVRYEDA